VAGASPVEAAANATATAGHSVVVAGVSVLIGITGLVFSGIPSFASMGFAAGLVVLATMLVSITLLPALLGLAGLRVFGRRARRAPVLPMDSFHSPRAQRMARRVVSRPGRWLMISVLALLALAAPGLGMRLGQSDAGSESVDQPTRQAYDLVSASFGPGANGPLLLVADRHAVAHVDRLAVDLATVGGVAEVFPPVVAADGSTALIQVIPTTGPSDEATGVLVRRLADQLPDGVDITGPTAAGLDMTTTLSAQLWWVILAVLSATFVLLLVVFRSIVVPLKAVVGNLLSVCASFGVLTLAFQTDLGAQLLGLPGPIPIVAWAPVILFAILFGLSMDYEVFMLSAIREQREAGVTGRAGIVAGLSSTTRIITSAAAIMIAVAAGFALDPSVLVKIIGVGMATAILVDVTLVRMLLVPAAMALLDEGNWYLPGWLDRLLQGSHSAASPSLHSGTFASQLRICDEGALKTEDRRSREQGERGGHEKGLVGAGDLHQDTRGSGTHRYPQSDGGTHPGEPFGDDLLSDQLLHESEGGDQRRGDRETEHCRRDHHGPDVADQRQREAQQGKASERVDEPRMQRRTEVQCPPEDPGGHGADRQGSDQHTGHGVGVLLLGKRNQADLQVTQDPADHEPDDTEHAKSRSSHR
jgi:hypothetical protein